MTITAQQAQTDEYDVIVIGGGAVGENAADRAVQGGLTAVIVEAELVGGECSYWACMPSKALLRSGAVVRSARRAPGADAAVTGAVDPSKAFAWRTEMTHDWNDAGQVRWLDRAGIALVRGHARLTGERTVGVSTVDGSTRSLRARRAVVLATGSVALLPDIDGLADVGPWTSRDATSSTSVPKRLAVLGGGAVGVEMADAYSSFGAEVTVLARSGLLGAAEPFAGELVAQSLSARGVDIRTGAGIASARRDDAGVLQLALSDGSTLEADELLVAVGRSARTEDVGLETVGLEPGGWVPVDESLRVMLDGEPSEWLYAVGDVNHRALLTHEGKYQARAAGDRIAAVANGGPVEDFPWGAHAATADVLALPQVVFSDPQVASAGLTAEQAEQLGYRTTVVDYDLSWVAGASVVAHDYAGTARAVIDDDRQVIVGVTFVGQDVAELVHSAAIAIAGEVPLSRLWHAVPAYPTLGEVWLRFLEQYGRVSALSPEHRPE